MVIKNFLVKNLLGGQQLVALAVGVMVAMFRLKSVTISDHGNQEFLVKNLVNSCC